MGTIKEGYILSVIDPESNILGDIKLGGYNLDIPVAKSYLVGEIKDTLPPDAFENNPGGNTKEVGMEPLTLITEEREYEPEYSNHETIAESNPGNDVALKVYKEAIRVATKAYGEAVESAAARETYRKALEAAEKAYKEATGHSSNPGNPNDLSEPIGSTFHSLMLHAVAEMYGPGGIVVDEAKAKATSCQCVEYKPGKLWCTSKGVVGALADEQEKIYCNPMEMVERPGVKERLAKWGEAVDICRAKLPPTDGRTRLEIYLDCMSKELTKAGVEA